jgi:hypothetical protein
VAKERLSVRAGSNSSQYGGSVHHLQAIYDHPLFDPYWYNFDYSILELENEISLNGLTTVAAALPTQGEDLPTGNDVLVR